MELGAEPGVPSALSAPEGHSWVPGSDLKESMRTGRGWKRWGTAPCGESLGSSLPSLLSRPLS